MENNLLLSYERCLELHSYYTTTNLVDKQLALSRFPSRLKNKTCYALEREKDAFGHNDYIVIVGNLNG